MGVAWLGTFPTTFEKNSFSEVPQDGVIRTSMDTGPTKVRRRFTAISKYWTGTMIFNNTQKSAWDTYYESSLAYGSLTISFPNQWDAGVTTVEARLREPVSFTPYSDTLEFEASFSLEVLP